MANAVTITCQRRHKNTKGYLNDLKRRGFTPGIIYGKGMDNQAICIDSRQLSRVFQEHGSRGLFSLQVEDGNPIMAVVRETQRNPLSGNIIHVDFWKVKMDEKINSTVGISIIGEEEVLKKGFVLQLGAKEIEISSLPADIPESVFCDVAALEIGDKITVGELVLPLGVELLSDPDSIVVTVLAPARAGTGTETEESEAGEAEEG